MRSLIVLLTVLACAGSTTGQRILHFTKTSGFDHQTRNVSNSMFLSIANDLGIDVDDDATGDPFSAPNTLAQYAVIVFSNTSGSGILSFEQRANFEQWVASGGHVLGIHAASDTYRHSSANGNNTGTWDFYAELIGGSVQENPNHVNGTPEYSMELIGTHASTANLPDPWLKNEEFYYWEGGFYGPDNVEVLRVEQTVGPNGQVNSYDAPRPMSWYRVLPQGNRIFYTALGHAPGNFTSDMLFRTHIKDALRWLLDGATGVNTQDHIDQDITYSIVNDMMHITTNSEDRGGTLRLFDAIGRTVYEQRVNSDVLMIHLRDISPGVHILTIGDNYRARIVITR